MVELHKEHPEADTPLEAAFAEVQRRLRLVMDSKHEEIPGFYNKAGLCRNCYWGPAALVPDEADDQALDLFRDAGMQAWGEFSGSSDYPVPGPQLTEYPEAASRAYNHSPDLYAGEYGDARRRLAAHLLAWNDQHKAELFLNAEVLRAG